VFHILNQTKRLIYFCCRLLHRRFLRWTKPPPTSLLLGTIRDLTRGKAELVAENALLRQQLIILRRQIKRPICTKTDRPLLVLLAKAVRAWRQALLIVQPETLLKWYRQGCAPLLEAQIKGEVGTSEGESLVGQPAIE
jgi:putative transposase